VTSLTLRLCNNTCTRTQKTKQNKKKAPGCQDACVYVQALVVFYLPHYLPFVARPPSISPFLSHFIFFKILKKKRKTQEIKLAYHLSRLIPDSLKSTFFFSLASRAFSLNHSPHPPSHTHTHTPSPHHSLFYPSLPVKRKREAKGKGEGGGGRGDFKNKTKRKRAQRTAKATQRSSLYIYM
jgi:hypothetical protein